MFSKFLSKFIFGLLIILVNGQYELGEDRRGENRGDLTPGQIATITFLVIAVMGALSVTLFFCYYVNKQSNKSHSRYAIPQGS